MPPAPVVKLLRFFIVGPDILRFLEFPEHNRWFHTLKPKLFLLPGMPFLPCLPGGLLGVFQGLIYLVGKYLRRANCVLGTGEKVENKYVPTLWISWLRTREPTDI